MNGLDDMEAARLKRASTNRRVPPPKNPPRSTAVELSLPENEPDPALLVQSLTVERAVSKPPTPTVAAELQQLAVTDEITELSKYSVYFDTNMDDFLDEVQAAGRQQRPKIAPSRSAVVRLALTKLAEAMTPEQIVLELASRAPKRTGTGRQRL